MDDVAVRDGYNVLSWEAPRFSPDKSSHACEQIFRSLVLSRDVAVRVWQAKELGQRSPLIRGADLIQQQGNAGRQPKAGSNRARSLPGTKQRAAVNRYHGVRPQL